MSNIRQLRYFLEIAKRGSFTKAAAALSVAQSALSYQIQQLEAELEVKLLTRDRRGVSLTEAGIVALHRAQILVEGCNQFKSQVSALASQPSGPVSLSILPSLARMLVVPLVEDFQSVYPNVRLLLEEGTASTNYGRLKDGRTDLAFLHDGFLDREIESTTVVREQLHLIGAGQPPDFLVRGTVSIEELTETPLILTTTASSWRRRIEGCFHAKGLQPRIGAEIDSLAATMELVRRGFGYSIVPKSAVHVDLQSGQIWAVRIGPDTISFEIELASLRYRDLSLAGMVLKKFLIRTVQQLTDPPTASHALPEGLSSRVSMAGR